MQTKVWSYLYVVFRVDAEDLVELRKVNKRSLIQDRARMLNLPLEGFSQSSFWVEVLGFGNGIMTWENDG